MEGPTPVSALIHAATMVTAGVYLVARCTPLFVHVADAQVLVVSGIGAVDGAAGGADRADAERPQARAGVFDGQPAWVHVHGARAPAAGGAALATPAVTAGMFHLFTHAFFKALLFLAAGSVMHAMGDVIDMRRFSGLRRVLPITHWTFLCGAAALAGVPLLSGFWSKDEILAVLSHASHHGDVRRVLSARSSGSRRSRRSSRRSTRSARTSSRSGARSVSRPKRAIIRTMRRR